MGKCITGVSSDIMETGGGSFNHLRTNTTVHQNRRFSQASRSGYLLATSAAKIKMLHRCVTLRTTITNSSDAGSGSGSSLKSIVIDLVSFGYYLVNEELNFQHRFYEQIWCKYDKLFKNEIEFYFVNELLTDLLDQYLIDEHNGGSGSHHHPMFSSESTNSNHNSGGTATAAASASVTATAPTAAPPVISVAMMNKKDVKKAVQQIIIHIRPFHIATHQQKQSQQSSGSGSSSNVGGGHGGSGHISSVFNLTPDMYGSPITEEETIEYMPFTFDDFCNIGQWLTMVFVCVVVVVVDMQIGSPVQCNTQQKNKISYEFRECID